MPYFAQIGYADLSDYFYVWLRRALRAVHQDLFATMIGYLNMGLGPEDAVERNPLKPYEAEFGDPSAFTYGALRSMMIAYVPD